MIQLYLKTKRFTAAIPIWLGEFSAGHQHGPDLYGIKNDRDKTNNFEINLINNCMLRSYKAS